MDSETSPDAAWRADVLDRMCRVIAHRGPDDQGTLVGDGFAVGMRRLSIIDLAGGRQPITGCEGRGATVVFNGEIYNYRELRADLEARGHTLRTRSDTEAIVHAYEEWGAGCVERLRGMFAFAIWDAPARTLFIARDRVGKKPLYYCVTAAGALVFGSELKSLLEHPDVEREVSPEAVDAYLTFGYVPDPLCIFGDVYKLPPGHHLTFKNGRATVTQYWDFPVATADEERAGDATPTEKGDDEIVAELRSLLDEAVRVRLIADVPLGAFLSGGVDSSTVVGLMSRHSDRPVKTFSIGFREDSYSELHYARVASRHFKTEHHELVVTPDICHLVDELAWHFDEPFADPSALPTYMVSKLAREHVKVALSGDGGDELFAGYTRYGVDARRRAFTRLPRALRLGLVQPLSRRLPHGARGRNFLHRVSFDDLDRYVEEISVFTRLTKPELYEGDFRKRLAGAGADAAALFRAHAAGAAAADPLGRLLYLDSKTYLPGDILTKVDRMSMAVSLEARVPLLDHRLVEFAARIPSRLKLRRGGGAKYVLKKAVADLVPPEILHRPKMGFGVPLEQWINDQLRERIRGTITDSLARSRGYVSPRYVSLLLDEHARGRRDHASELWALFMLELWHRRFVDGGAARRDTGRDAAAEQLSPAVA